MSEKPDSRAVFRLPMSAFPWNEAAVEDPAQARSVRRLMGMERAEAEAEMARRFAAMQMPEDIRSRAKAWGMEAFCEVLWSNAFQAGYREAMRDREKS